MRRRLFSFVLALLAVFLAPPLPADDASSTSWVSFRGPGARGISAERAVFTAADGARPPIALEIAWKTPLGAGYSGISMADGRVFTAFSDAASGQDTLIALDAATGKEIWRYAFDTIYVGHDGSHDGPIATPLVADGRVFGLAPRGPFFALDAATGELLWTTHLLRDHGIAKPHYGFGTSPLLHHGMLLLELGEAAEKAEGEADDEEVRPGVLAAFDPATGERLWTTGEDSIGYQVPVPWTFDGREELVTPGDARLFGIDPAKGEITWSFEHGGRGGRGSHSLTAVPVGDGRLFLAHDNDASKVVELRRGEDGEIAVETLWEDRVIRNSYNVPVYHEGHLYAYSARFLTCVDAATGEAKWRSRAPGDGFLILVDGHLVVATKSGGIHLAEATPEGYVERAGIQVFDDISWTPPSFADGSIYARSQDAIARIDPRRGAHAAPRNIAQDASSPFGRFLTEAFAAEEAARPALVDRFLDAQASLPVIERDRVHFLYRGPAADVAVAGDLFGARREEAMTRLPGTDLFHTTVELEADARANYLFIEDFQRQIVDPRNPRRTSTTLIGQDMEMRFGGEPLEMSWLAMPEWREPAHLADAPEEKRGRVETHEVASEELGERKATVAVYLPRAYDADPERRFPVAYFHGGAAARERGRLPNSLDHLIGDSVAPVIVAFIDIPARGGGYDKVFLDQIIPLVDTTYRTRAEAASRANLGTGFSGTGALIVTLSHPDLFAKAGAQSPFLFRDAREELDGLLDGLEGEPPTIYLDWGTYDFRNPHENWNMADEARGLAAKLDALGIPRAGGEAHDGSDWSSWKNRTEDLFKALFPLVEPNLQAQANLQALASPEARPDQPDLAARYYDAQRFAGGAPRDPLPFYEDAVEQMARMPRYSSRLGRSLPPLGDKTGKTDGELGTWEALGPGNIGGRTRALLIHPERPRIRYAAGVSGGIWKSEDGGASWRSLGDLLPNITVSALAMDPSDPDILYAGTGEGFLREVVRQSSLPLRGAGIFKSVDGGETWTRLAATRTRHFHWVNDLAISVRDPKRIYAATRTGVWRSRDGGEKWTRILKSERTGGCLSLALRGDRPADLLLAACGTLEQAAVFHNPKAALSARWTEVLTEPGMGRTSLAFAPSRPEVAYALSASYVSGPGGAYFGGLHAVHRSSDGGLTWEAVSRNTDPNKLDTTLLTYADFALGAECGNGGSVYVNLGWYANVIRVDPTDADVVFVGGVNVFRSDDGGRSWGVIGFRNQIHPDQHALVFHPAYDGAANQTLFTGNDGGIWTTTNARGPAARQLGQVCNLSNGVRWTSLNHGYGVTQFYHGAVFPRDGGPGDGGPGDGGPSERGFLGGAQDNGTLLGSTERGHDGWSGILGGDGGYVAVDPRNPNIVYAESQGITLSKSFDGGRSWSRHVNGIQERGLGADGPDTYGDVLFIVPFTLDPNDPDRLWWGGRRIYRSDDGAARWTLAGAPWPRRAKLSAVAVAPGDSDRVAAGLDDGGIHISNAARTSNFTTPWPGVRPRPGFVSSIAFDPTNPNRLYATYATFGGRHLWTSTDGGTTWNHLDGNGPSRLPNLPTHAIAIDPDDSQHLYLGTDLGVFVSLDRGRSWKVENSGFANVVTEALEIVRGEDGVKRLYAFTHGRGAFRVEIGG